MTATATNPNIIPFAFEDNLVRVFKPNGEPWFVGRDVCRVLDIKNESQALARLDPDEKNDGVCIIDPIGREQTVICVSEAGVFRLVFTSRKPEAERFKRWLAHEVLPALRKTGSYTVPGRAPVPEEASGQGAIGGEPLAVVAQKLAMVRESRLIHGIDRARMLWHRLGLPEVPGSNDAAVSEARACLRLILSQPIAEVAEPGTPFTVLHGILSELDDNGIFDGRLRALGIRVFPDQEGFVVSNRIGSAPGLGSLWNNQRPARLLLNLPGARRHGPIKFESVTHRGVFIPAAALDFLDNVPTAH